MYEDYEAKARGLFRKNIKYHVKPEKLSESRLHFQLMWLKKYELIFRTVELHIR